MKTFMDAAAIAEEVLALRVFLIGLTFTDFGDFIKQKTKIMEFIEERLSAYPPMIEENVKKDMEEFLKKQTGFFEMSTLLSIKTLAPTQYGLFLNNAVNHYDEANPGNEFKPRRKSKS